MKIGVISDAHGNSEGLRTCLDFLHNQKVEAIYFLGDAVGYFPDANGVIALLEKNVTLSHMGNHDAMLLEQLPLDAEKDEVYKIAESRQHLRESAKGYLQQLKPSAELNTDGKKILMVHGSPFDALQGYVYPDSELDPVFDLGYDMVLMGHTHRAFTVEKNGQWIMNVGSCGLPRDIGNMAGVAVLDFAQEKYEIHRVPLNVEAIEKKYPQVHASVKDCLNRK